MNYGSGDGGGLRKIKVYHVLWVGDYLTDVVCALVVLTCSFQCQVIQHVVEHHCVFLLVTSSYIQ